MFTDVKIGDRVVVCGLGLGQTGRSIATVEYLTPKQFQVKTGRGNYEKFWKDGGRMVGRGTWSSARAEPATPELIEEVRIENRLKNARCLLTNLSWLQISDEKVLAVLEVIGD